MKAAGIRRTVLFSMAAVALAVSPVRADQYGKPKGEKKSENKGMGKGDGSMACHMGEGGKEMGDGPACPMMVKGAKLELENLPNGISVKVTADDPDTVKRIQDKALRMKERHEMMAEKMEAKEEKPAEKAEKKESKDSKPAK